MPENGIADFNMWGRFFMQVGSCMTNYPCFTSCDNNIYSRLLSFQLSSGGVLVKLLCYQQSCLNCSWEMADHNGFHLGKKSKVSLDSSCFCVLFLAFVN